MLNQLRIPAIVALLCAGAACDSGRHAATGFRLPPDGDAEKGKAAFLAFECNSCHAVSGMDLPEATARSSARFVLGGDVISVTDGYLVRAIIDPPQRHATSSRRTTGSGHTDMPLYADSMNIRQLTDIVAFLQSHYTVRTFHPKYGYH